MQALHTLIPGEEEKDPARQEEQMVANAAEYIPAAQLPVTADKPAEAQDDPAVQALHALIPADAAKEPAKQLVQLDEDAMEEKVPTKQDEQTCAEAAEYFPAAQLPVTADSPVVAQ